jgi:hypothetical protein
MSAGHFAIGIGAFLILSGVIVFSVMMLGGRERQHQRLVLTDVAGPVWFRLTGPYPELALVALGVVLVVIGVWAAR